MEQREVTLHGHRVAYRCAGDSGPVVVLIHGIAGNCSTWDDVGDRMAGHLQIIAPDMLGHGETAKPRGDYSLGAFATGLRDLLELLGHERVTVVGHSLGGGVAMQFAYQFPERCERLVLVSSGGLGRQVTPFLRAATLPGAELILPLIAHEKICASGALVGRLLGRFGVKPGAATLEMAHGYASLARTDARAAFVHTARGVMDPFGQRVDGTERLYLARDLPTMIIWGRKDTFVPVRHGERAHHKIVGSRLEVFERAGHFPHRDEPERFAEVLLDFVKNTEPAHLTPEVFRERLVSGA